MMAFSNHHDGNYYNTEQVVRTSNEVSTAMDESKIMEEVEEKMLTSTKKETLLFAYQHLTQRAQTSNNNNFEKYQFISGYPKLHFLSSNNKSNSTSTFLVSVINHCLFELQYSYQYIFDFNAHFFDYPNRPLDAQTLGIFAKIYCGGQKYSEAEVLLENYIISKQYRDLSEDERLIFDELIALYLNGCLLPQFQYNKAISFILHYFRDFDDIKTQYLNQIYVIVENEKLTSSLLSQIHESNQQTTDSSPSPSSSSSSSSSNNNQNTEKQVNRSSSSVASSSSSDVSQNIIVNNNNNNDHKQSGNNQIVKIFKRVSSNLFYYSNFIITKLQQIFGANKVSNAFLIIASFIVVMKMYQKRVWGKKLLSFYGNQLIDFVDIAFNTKNSIRRMKRNQIPHRINI